MQQAIINTVYPVIRNYPAGCSGNDIESISPSQDTYEQAAIASVRAMLGFHLVGASVGCHLVRGRLVMGGHLTGLHLESPKGVKSQGDEMSINFME